MPRIKQAYCELLQTTARDLDAPIIRTSVPRDTDDGAYFVDYCHPLGAANEAIAERLATVIRKYQSGALRVSISKPSILVRFLDSRFMDAVAGVMSRPGRKPAGESPDNKDIYTLY